MARNTQLLDLIAQLRAETGRTQNVAVGVNEIENLKDVLRRVQATLYDEYHWDHMNVEETVAIVAGQRYYDLPSNLNFDRISEVVLRYNTVYVPLEKGVEFNDYSIFDSNASTPERSYPLIKWDIRNTGAGEQLEFWPISNTTSTVYFRGTKPIGDLIQEADTADLDDHMIVLFAAAEILSRQKSNDAKVKLSQAERRLSQLRKNATGPSEPVQIGLGNRDGEKANRNRTRVIVS
jgi:hypothetical protein